MVEFQAQRWLRPLLHYFSIPRVVFQPLPIPSKGGRLEDDEEQEGNRNNHDRKP